MASKLAIICSLIAVLAIRPFALADCPLLKEPPPWDEDGDPYWVIHSQADADILQTCSTFTGVLIISGSEASSPIIVDGPRHIKGKLKVEFNQHLHPRLTLFSMKSLVSVDGEVHLMQYAPTYETRWSNLTTLDFPVLNSVSRFFHISSLPEIHTINMPYLERVSTLWLTSMESLHTLRVPNLQFVANLRLIMLPSLKTLSFDAGLQDMALGFGYNLYIWMTALESLSGLHFIKASTIDIISNKNLTSLSFPFLKLVAQNPHLGGAELLLRDNGENFHLVLPRLERIKGSMYLADVRTVHIPELRYIEGNLNLGAYEETGHCHNCLKALTTFSALKLTKICGSLNIGPSPQLKEFKLPLLSSIDGDVIINDSAAVDLRTGIEMPRLGQVHSVQIIGLEPYCEVFDRMHEQGAIRDRYWCGKVGKWTAEELRHKLWSDMQGIHGCEKGSSGGCCGSGMAMYVGAKAKFGAALATVVVFWYIKRKYRKRLRS